jgi:hypothetical protein
VRGGLLTIAIAAGALSLPASAIATNASWFGGFPTDPNPSAALHFAAKGKFNKKGKFITRRVTDFDADVTIGCFDEAGNQTSTGLRTDLAPGLIPSAPVSKKGRFAGTSTTATGLTYTIAGLLRKGKGSGTVSIAQGAKGAVGYCSTGTFANPTVDWHVKLIPPVCGAVPTGRSYRSCVGP